MGIAAFWPKGERKPRKKDRSGGGRGGGRDGHCGGSGVKEVASLEGTH